MAKVKQETSIVNAYSKEPLGVMAGGFIMGFGGVAVYAPQAEKPTQLSLQPEDSLTTRGFVFDYRETARIYVNGELRWINRTLPEAPQDRQDIREVGVLKLELFRSKRLLHEIKKNKTAFALLGLNFEK